MSDLLDSKGERINDLQFNLKKQSANHLADRKALHSKQGAIKPFKDEEDMIKTAETAFEGASKTLIELADKERELGFDIKDAKSIKNFKVGYTPFGTLLLVKIIYEEQKIGNILVPDNTALGRKAIVIVPGSYVTDLKKGDVVQLRPTSRGQYGGIDHNALPPHVERVFNGIKFHEITMESILGVYIDREEYIQRSK